MSGKYRTIVADPPWHYDHRPGNYQHRVTGRAAPAPNVPLPYDTLTATEIAALPVSSLAAADAHLYLWTTQRYLSEAFTVLAAWGFKQSAVLVWSKPPKGIVGTFVCSTEFCLFARRGNLPAKSKHMGTSFTWPRGKHSEKPDAFLDLVEQVSPGPYLEMFARRARLGDWSYWGDESLGTVETPTQEGDERRPFDLIYWKREDAG